MNELRDTLRQVKKETQKGSAGAIYCSRNFLVNYCKHVGVPESEVDTIFGDCWSEEHGFYILKGEPK
jgi:hypothetical protein